jgi:penicillin-binding protein 2
MDKKEIFLEESVLDDMSEGLDMVEKPLSENVFRIVGWILIGLILATISRVAYAQFINGKAYDLRALANSGQQTILKAPRGVIYDRYGKVLVSNEPSFSVTLNLSELFKNESNLDASLQAISQIVPLDIESLKKEIFAVDLERQAYVPLAQNISLSQVIDLKKLNLRSVVIENSYTRKYVDGPVFSQIVGYTGIVNQKNLDSNSQLELNDEIGKSGIELSYDRMLRGTNGVEIGYQDVKGNQLGTKTVNDPIGGDAITTTIDSDLQKFFYDSLKSQLDSLGRTAGAGLVINPQTGEILSLVSLPSFDNNNLTSQMFTDKSMPTFNRVISGVYSPGSTIKPLVAFGALKENIIDPLKKILSIGYIEIPNPFFPDKPSRFVDWRPQGWVDMAAALARSSNVYFYEVGGGFSDKSPNSQFGGVNQTGLGINRLIEYWKEFKLDQPTGIDLPGENVGVLANPETREKSTGQIWRIGDTYNVSIGQGDLRITPLELLRYISTIPNRGKMPVPFVVSTAKDAQGNVDYGAQQKYDVVDSSDNNFFNIIEKGMMDGVTKNYGTSFSLADIPMTIAAKTGSAQIQNNQKTNAFFVGYNIPPTNSSSTLAGNSKNLCSSVSSQCSSVPQQIAVLVMIEDAKEGSLNAVPVAKKVFQWYYDNRIANSK